MSHFSRVFLSVLFFAVSAFTSGAQTTFIIDNFSPSYYGQIIIEDTAAVFSKGSVSIFERSNPKAIIHVESDELALSLHEGKAVANIKELPYGEQSLIIFEDFNFDGKKDFAIEDGQNSCYHGPSFQIYLSTLTGFEYSEAFTALAQEYCGLFDVDANFKTLHTMTKDGCCWHQFSEFIVEDNKPKVVHVIEEDASHFPFVSINEENWDGTKMVNRSTRTFDRTEERVKEIFSFKVEKNYKKVIVYQMEETLNYVLLNGEDEVEFAFPFDAAGDDPKFLYNKKSNTLSFKNKDASYTIVNTKSKAGIEIRWNGKVTYWNAVLSTRKGDLNKIAATKLENVLSQ